MSTDTPTAITLDDLATATGLGRIQAANDVEAGLLPGRFRYGKTGRRLQYICPPGEFAQWLAGEWQPRPQPQPVSLIRRKAS